MSAPLSVRLAAQAADHGATLATLATLPNRFCVTDGAADVQVVSCAGEIAGEALPFLADPARFSPAELDRLIAGGRPVGLASATARALTPEALAMLRIEDGTPPVITDALAETTGQGPLALRRALLDLSLLLDQIAGPVTAMRLLSDTPRQIILAADLASGWSGARLTVRSTTRDRFAVHAVSRILRRQVEIDTHAPAIPARVTLHDAQGARSPAPLHQGSLRQCWIDLHEDRSPTLPALRRLLPLLP